MELVSFEKLKEVLHLERDSIESYPALQILADSCQSSFESYLCRFLEDDTYTETFDAEDWDGFFPLKGLPIKSIKDVRVDGELCSMSPRIRTDGVQLPVRAGVVSIKYYGGYDEIPADIERAALFQIVHEYQGHDHLGATSVSTDGGSVRRPQLGLLWEVKRLLNKHVNYAVKGA
ncbi:TPA: hypothetical protein NJ322_005019 [Vibrio parahaemolyticus]|nr:hypothetical protein [Vibrio parahaemolyticus]HCG7105663.1 hypothetical protein [Vibrio parahaemolyticus]